MLICVEINLCTTSWDSFVFLWVVRNPIVLFFSASVGKAHLAQLYTVRFSVPIRWRSTWITCDFPRLWSALLVSPQTTLIWWLPSESSINTSVDSSLSAALKEQMSSKAVGIWHWRWEQLFTASPVHLLCLSERVFSFFLSDWVWTAVVRCGISATEKN